MGIIPNRKRFKSWAMPTKILVIVGVVGLLIAFIGLFAKSSSTNNIDSSTINNQVDSSTTNVFTAKGENKIIDNTLVYSLSGIRNPELEKLIKKDIKISFDKNANNVIEISHTGEIQLLSENTASYIFTGGVVSVLINNNACFEFENYTIPSMRANPKKAILNELNRVISSYVEDNVNEFSKIIVQCIKG